MICFPNAKINIGLNVVSKRSDGFHNIESVFYPIPVCDILEVIENKNSKKNTAEIYCSGIKVYGNPQDNLCVKAYQVVCKEVPLPGIDIYLHKIIPTGAGMGGGSADAAFLIKMLNDKFELGFDTTKMKQLAARIGSDCSFFIDNAASFAEEKGEKLSDIRLSLSGYHIWIVKPDIHMNTAVAYSMLSPNKAKYDLKKVIENEPIENWKKHIVNDFEIPVSTKHPEIKMIKDFFYEAGATYASMTGSGSAIYGIFTELPQQYTLPLKNIFEWRGKLS